MVMVIPWLILASIFLILEILTGSFYLLILALAFGFGALLQWLNFVWPVQVFGVSILIFIGFFVLRVLRKNQTELAVIEDSLDVGAFVTVISWSQKVGRIRYRGTEWTAISETPQCWPSGTQVIICRVEGRFFVVKSCC